MSSFNFRLQKILEMRIDKEETAKLELKKAIDEKNKTADKLEKLEGKFEKTYNNKNIGNVVERKLKENYLNKLDDEIAVTKDDIVSCDENVYKKRADLILAQRDKKSVEILKEKQYKEFVLEENSIEQRNNDEFALYGHIRNIERR